MGLIGWHLATTPGPAVLSFGGCFYRSEVVRRKELSLHSRLALTTHGARTQQGGKVLLEPSEDPVTMGSVWTEDLSVLPVEPPPFRWMENLLFGVMSLLREAPRIVSSLRSVWLLSFRFGLLLC